MMQRNSYKQGTDSQMALVYALLYREFTQFFRLLPRANINARGPLDMTPLIVACMEPTISPIVIEFLLAAGAWTEDADVTGMTPLMWACAGSRFDVMELLVQRKANIHAQDHYGYDALYHAVHANHLMVAQWLLDHGANPNHRSHQGERSLGVAPTAEMLRLLIRYGGRVDPDPGDAFVPAIDFLKTQRMALLDVCIEHGFDPLIRNDEGCTFLDMLAQRPAWGSVSSLEILERLLDGGLDPDMVPDTWTDAIPILEERNPDRSCAILGTTQWIHALKMTGKIQLIVGPMFSGKTTELLRRVRRYAITKKCLLIKHGLDTRYHNAFATTHDQITMEAVTTHQLVSVSVDNYEVIGIDEGQFFSDLVVFAETYANQGKIILVAGLDGTYQREPFGSIAELMPKSEEVVKLTAVCSFCGNEAPFSKRTTSCQDEVEIGGADKYVAVCRTCYFT